MKKNILIVDDEPDLRNLIKMALEGNGYNVTTAADGDECLEKLNNITKKPDLILLDIMMPGTPAKEIVQRIKNIKIAYLSIVKTSDLEKKRILEQPNVVDYIPKSFDLDEFTTRIDYLLSESNIVIKKEIEKCQNILVTIPNPDYDMITTDIISQIYTKRVCYVTLNKTYGSLKDFFNKKKISTTNIAFVDGITKTVTNTENRKDCSFVSSPGALEELMVAISNLLSQKYNYLIFDSLSDLLTYRDVDEVEQFVKNITDSLAKNKCKGIFYALSRYKFAPKNRLDWIMYPNNRKEGESLIEEQIISFDKIVDLRKKGMKSVQEVAGGG